MIAVNLLQRLTVHLFQSNIAVSFEIRKAIYNIYGFVRFADEIVDTFHDYPKKDLLDDFMNQYFDAKKKEFL
jgi:phytoene/squalene synthetase